MENTTVASPPAPQSDQKISPLVQHSKTLADLLKIWIKFKLSNQEIVASFILCALTFRTRGKWAVGPRKSETPNIDDNHTCQLIKLKDVPNLLSVLKFSPKILNWCNVSSPDEITLCSIFVNLRLRGIKPSTNNAMIGWFENKRPLVLLHHIPSPNEVLKQQAFGKRVITLFLQESDIASYHVSKLEYMSGNHCHGRDALDFLIHDLSHIELFCESTTYVEQVGFFHHMYQLDPTRNGKPFRFFRKFANMKVLWPQFQYVFSDMNCHSTHLLSYLKAKWLMHDKQRMQCLGSHIKEEENGNNECKLGKEAVIGFRQGWPKMLQALGMTGVALEGANKLCCGEKMTQKHGEAIRDFFRKKGKQVIEENNLVSETGGGGVSGGGVVKEKKKLIPLSAPSSSSTPLPTPKPRNKQHSMTVTEKVAQQVNEIRQRRNTEVQSEIMKLKNEKEMLIKSNENYLKQQEIHYHNIIGNSFLLERSFMASHAARRGHENNNTAAAAAYEKHANSLNYGEIPFNTFAFALQQIKTKYNGLLGKDKHIFYDLGSGTGKVCISAALCYPFFHKIIGIELLKELYDVSVQVLKSYNSYINETFNIPLPSTNANAIEKTLINTNTNTLRQTKGAPYINTILGDITEIPWYKDATIIFCNTLVFDDTLLLTLAEQLKNVSSGCFLITSGRLNSENRLSEHFTLLECSMQKYSWGMSSLWIHQRK